MNILKTPTRFLALQLIALSLTFSSVSYAGPGHEEKKIVNKTNQSLPHFYAESDLYEITGIVRDGEIKLYLDRFQSNEPVKEAMIEIEIEGAKISAKPNSDGEYFFEIKNKFKDQVTPVSIIINDDGETDILISAIDLSHSDSPSIINWKTGIKILLFIIFALAVLYGAYRHRNYLMRQTQKMIKRIQEYK